MTAKKLIMVLGMTALVVGAACAYTVPESSLTNIETRLDQDNAQKVSLTGTLTLNGTKLGLQVGNKIYTLAGITNFNIIDGFKAGATVSIEGYQDYNTVYCQNVMVNGQSYKALTIGDYDYAGTDFNGLWTL